VVPAFGRLATGTALLRGRDALDAAPDGATLVGAALGDAVGGAAGAVKVALGALAAWAATAIVGAVGFPEPDVDTADGVGAVAAVGLCAVPHPARSRVSPVAMPMMTLPSARLAIVLMVSP
jgi:hypothetical protein